MLHTQIKEQIKEALRNRDTLRLETLRGVNSLCLNELIASGSTADTITDDKVLNIIKRSVKQRKDSIEQFTKGGRNDLATKEQSELAILESFLPKMLSKDEVYNIIKPKIDALESAGAIDPKSSGKIIGTMIKELAGTADGNDVKSVVEEILTKKQQYQN
jgi:uncharacterized protein YqeY